MAWSSVTPPTAGTPVSDITFGVPVATNMGILGNAWIDDTATRSAATIWTANTSNPTLGNGTLVSRYRLTGKTLDWEVLITMGSTTTFGSGQWKLVPPATPLTTGGEHPVGALLDTSSGNRYAVYAIRNSGSFDLQASVTAGPFNSIDASTPMAWNTGDQLSFRHTCEVA